MLGDWRLWDNGKESYVLYIKGKYRGKIFKIKVIMTKDILFISRI